MLEHVGWAQILITTEIFSLHAKEKQLASLAAVQQQEHKVYCNRRSLLLSFHAAWHSYRALLSSLLWGRSGHLKPTDLCVILLIPTMAVIWQKGTDIIAQHFRVSSHSWMWQYSGEPQHLCLTPTMDYQNAVPANMVKQRKEEWRRCVYVVKSRWIICNHRHFILSLSDITVAKFSNYCYCLI